MTANLRAQAAKQPALALAWAAIAVACSKEPTTSDAESAEGSPSTTPSAAAAPNQTATPTLGLVDSNARAAIGSPAPDFALSDLDGKVTRLSDQRGKIVVLEWFNPECPFVNRAHTKGSLVGTADKHRKQGVVWLAVNSAGPGRQGYGVAKNRAGVATLGLDYPVLLDESGQVGKAYGAAHTPHMFVIDEQGVLVYRGAIDNSPDAEQESPEGGKLVNYVDQALSDLKSERAVETKETEAYGCSVKYGN